MAIILTWVIPSIVLLIVAYRRHDNSDPDCGRKRLDYNYPNLEMKLGTGKRPVRHRKVKYAAGGVL